jgi:hypothetical protein
LVDWATTSEAFRRIVERNKIIVQMESKIGRQFFIGIS